MKRNFNKIKENAFLAFSFLDIFSYYILLMKLRYK